MEEKELTTPYTERHDIRINLFVVVASAAL